MKAIQYNYILNSHVNTRGELSQDKDKFKSYLSQNIHRDIVLHFFKIYKYFYFLLKSLEPKDIIHEYIFSRISFITPILGLRLD